MGNLFERGSQARIIRDLRQVPDQESAIATIGKHLDPRLVALLDEAERTELYTRMYKKLHEMPLQHNRIEKSDIFGAIASFFLVFFSTVPAVIPFLWIDDFHTALRVSNGLLLALLFVVGYTWARYTNSNRWAVGFSLLLLGVILVVVAIALGG